MLIAKSGAFVKPILLALGVALVAAALPARAATVEVSVSNIREARGHIHVELCPERLFLGDCTILGEAPAQVGTTIVQILNVPPGVYAAQAYQDENDNHKVDRGLFGVPREGVGFSRDAKLYRHGPRFDEAAFRVTRAIERIALRLRHFL